MGNNWPNGDDLGIIADWSLRMSQLCHVVTKKANIRLPLQAEPPLQNTASNPHAYSPLLEP